MYVGVFNSANEAYKGILKELLASGKEVAPRGTATLELHPAIIQITNPRSRAVTLAARKLNYSFMLAEMIWMLTGSDGSWHHC